MLARGYSAARQEPPSPRAKLVAIKAFGLDPAKRKHLLVQEYA
jgi:hypothetical protein